MPTEFQNFITSPAEDMDKKHVRHRALQHPVSRKRSTLGH